ncbi:MAG: hypothetical protein AAFQ64_20025 [Pseudomonadota bacterium]
MIRTLAFLTVSFALSCAATAEETHQPYKGFETRAITSLPEQDIDALREGSGWRLALPAELNGFPGPAHVLELAEELGLSARQEESISSIFEAMRLEAIAKGKVLIDAEHSLDEGFRSDSMDADRLLRLIQYAEAARADLRYVHLSRHLMTLEVLDAEQVSAYAVLRGYSSEPCASAPDGHDATMWRRHNGCEDQ